MKAKKIIFNVLAVLFGLMMLNGGLNKFFDYMPQPDDMPKGAVDLFFAFLATGWILPLIAIVEIIAGVLIMIPKTRAFAAVMIFPITVGIMFFHLIQAPDGMVIGLVLFAINSLILFDNKDRLLPMIG